MCQFTKTKNTSLSYKTSGYLGGFHLDLAYLTHIQMVTLYRKHLEIQNKIVILHE